MLIYSPTLMKILFICTTKVIANIRTNSDTAVYTKYYPYPMSLEEEIEKQIQKLLDDGIIRPSRFPYNSTIWIVQKNGTHPSNKIHASNRLQET